jgi:hypothetical protein
LAVVSDAREFAVKFFRGFKEKWPGATPLEQDLVAIADETASLYEQVAATLSEMRSMFPFPQGGEPNDKDQALSAIRLLIKVKSVEEKAVLQMERMLERLSKEQ